MHLSLGCCNDDTDKTRRSLLGLDRRNSRCAHFSLQINDDLALFLLRFGDVSRRVARCFNPQRNSTVTAILADRWQRASPAFGNQRLPLLCRAFGESEI